MQHKNMANLNSRRSVRRKKRVRSNIFGTKEKPRISVFASNRYTYAQAIDDTGRKTLISFSSLEISQSENYKKNKKVEEAKKVGIDLAKNMIKKGIKTAVFDRGAYSYLGRVKALADGLREGGIII